ncbi:MAG: helix-turn-helix domain-containing protein [Candidatus Cryptobacteroides sp.]
MSNELSFNELPTAVATLIDKVDALTTLVRNRNDEDNKKEDDKWFNLEQLCDYLPDKPAKSTVYGWVSDNLIPYNKTGKKLRFLKSKIDLWLLENGRKTDSELQREAMNYLHGKRGGAL